MSKADTGYQDAADYVATMLTRYFPEIEVEHYMVKSHRPGLKVIVPVQSEYSVGQVDDAAFMLMQGIYAMSDCRYLITVVVQREVSNDD